MNFREFRSRVIEIPVTYDDGDGAIEFTVGYRPREILEEDLELLAQLQTARIADVATEEQPPPNRAARRAGAKAGQSAPPSPTRPGAGLIEHMKRLIASWSLTWGDDDATAEPWPVTEESFRLIEPTMRAVIIAAIVEHYLERPNRMSSSALSSAETASGQTGQTDASEPSNGVVESFPGTTPDSPTLVAVPSGSSG